jgi:archaellum component FlaF (FlaF/FlaG flagellin family)
MGFSLSASFAVIGVSILISVEILIGGLAPTIDDIDQSYDDKINRGIEKIQTDINISNVVISANSSNYDYNITLENIGSITLETNDFIILINGNLFDFSCFDSYLFPESETNLIINNVSGNGTIRLKILTENGISDYYEIII